MAFPVVGFDIGCSTSYIAVAKQGGIETIANEYSDRQTPTYVGFTERQRVIGLAAKLQQVTNVKNTIFNFTPLLGKAYDDSSISKDIQRLPYNIVNDEGRPCIEVPFQGETHIFLPEQVYAMQLTKLRKITEAAVDGKVVDVVINVPTYYTDSERRAVLDASRIAGLNCVKLVNDVTAIGTAYGLYNKDLEADAATRTVAFVSVGYVSTQVAICAFTSKGMDVIASACDPHLGGRDFDDVIYREAAHQFEGKYKLELGSSRKAEAKLLIECEKLKKSMSANSEELHLDIECLMNEKDLNFKMKRADFESLCDSLFHRFRGVLNKCMSLKNLSKENIHSVELVGGSSRIPALKKIVAEVFGQNGRTTLNADEAVARGCALQAAIISPAFRVRDFRVTDACPYDIGLSWNAVNNNETSETSLKIFPFLHHIPSSKRITIKSHGALNLKAFYLDPTMLPNQNVTIANFSVPDVPKKASTVRVDTKIDHDGIFLVCKVALAEEDEKEDEVVQQPGVCDNGVASEESLEDMETDVPINGDASVEPGLTDTQTTDKKTVKPDVKNNAVKKKVVRYKELPVHASFALYSTPINQLHEEECKMVVQDELEFQRSNAKNAVEEYVYEMRGELHDSLSAFATDEEKTRLSTMLEQTEEWLYGDGENLSRPVYVDRLNELKKIGDRIVMRANEKMAREPSIQNYKRSILEFREVLASVEKGEDKYSHIAGEKLDNLNKLIHEHEKWCNERFPALERLPLNQDPSLRVEEIKARHQTLESVCRPIVNTPKPAAPPPPPAAQNNNTSVTEDNLPATDAAAAAATEKMETNPVNPQLMECD